MMKPEHRRFVLRLLAQCKDFALATVTPDGVPEVSTVNFASDELTIYVATSRASAKVRNLQSSERVALALHGDYEDWSQVKGLSIAVFETDFQIAAISSGVSRWSSVFQGIVLISVMACSTLACLARTIA